MDLAGPFKKWKVDFLTGQHSTDKSSKAKHGTFAQYPYNA